MLTKSPYTKKGDPYENIKALTTAYEMLYVTTSARQQHVLNYIMILD